MSSNLPAHLYKTFTEVDRLISAKRAENPAIRFLNSRVLAHLISYAEYQFGARVPGKDCRQRLNGESMNNWGVEIEIMIPICFDLVLVYLSENSFTVEERNLALTFYKIVLDLLRPWSIMLDLNTTRGLNS
jgi:hypothetical protein